VGSHNITVRSINGCTRTKSITISPMKPPTCIQVTITRVK
jgi:hypothetical protein